MRVENTRSGRWVRLQHAAAFHRSRTDLVDQVLPMVLDGLRGGTPVALSVDPATESAVQRELDGTAGLILLSRPDGPDGESGQTLAARRARELRELVSATGRPLIVINEHTSRLDGVDGTFWTELDAAFNIALAELPVTMTCFYPELPLHREILDGARRNHPLLAVRGEMAHNPHHLAPREVLAEQPAPAPVLLGPPELRLPFGAWQLHDVRSAVEDALLSANCPRERAEDVVLAVNEVATNAVEHGDARAELLIWVTDDGVVCEIHDAGSLRDPLPGLQAPHSSNPRGRGVWIARQLCDSLHVWTDDRGTHVRMRASP
ncbi:ATP-binding protein [Pseudonocardia humida]|uniref:ATP-binding protein n=1 Tax=Pseudonocardia humida TaxID=2800819 RepID=A0ABT1A6S5_9PSEU|nr:ATP-binding protein [Pseudonocardia humida]MCO1658429.1 ATP-binding protein [Pseudonocardia humida]